MTPLLKLLVLAGLCHLTIGQSCGETLTAPQGVFLSPNYPNDYPKNTRCQWIINAPVGKTIRLTFLDFELERYSNCYYHEVELYNVDNTQSRIIGKFCGEMATPATFYSTSNSMRVFFRTQSSYTRKGFIAVYIIEEPSTSPATQPTTEIWEDERQRNLIFTQPARPRLDDPLMMTCVSFGDQTQVRACLWLKDYSHVAEFGSNCTVYIASVSQNYTGSYVCTTITDHGGAFSLEFHVQVSRPPIPRLVSPNPPYVKKGSTLDLSCRSDTGGVLSYNFYKDDFLVGRVPISDDLSYELHPQDDGGKFSCSAVNTAGESDKSTEISFTALGKSQVISTIDDPNRGDNLTLTCNTTIPISSDFTITWQKNLQFIGHSESTLILDNVQENDAGVYYCQLKIDSSPFEFDDRPSVSTIISSHGFVIAFDPPKPPYIWTSDDSVVMHRDSLNVYCKPNTTQPGDDIFRSDLYFNGVKVAETSLFNRNDELNSYAVFTERARFRAMGSYSCSLFNRRGESSQSNDYNITIESWVPSHWFLDALGIPDNDNYASCSPSDSFQRHNVEYCSLFVNGKMYAQLIQCSRLYIFHGFSGDVQCSATNDQGTSDISPVRSYRFVHTPVIRPVNQTPPVMGESYILKCVTDANGSDVTIEWLNGSRILHTGQDFPIDHVEQNTEHGYTCTVTQRIDGRSISVVSPTFFLRSSSLSTTVSRIRGSPSGINCSSSSYNGATLYKNGKRMSQSVSGFFRSVFRSEKQGFSLTCRGHTVFGPVKQSGNLYVPPQDSHVLFRSKRSEEKAGEIQVVSNPPIASLGQPLTLFCASTIADNATFVWIIEVPSSRHSRGIPGRVLNLDPVTQGDSGIYTCQVIIESPERIIILNSPPHEILLSVPVVPVLRKLNRQLLQCSCTSSDCDPLSPFRLYRDGVLVPEAEYGRVYYHSKAVQQFTAYRKPAKVVTYTCTAVNYFGESGASDPVYIDSIKEDPVRPYLRLTADNPLATLGDDVTMVCSLSRDTPENKITWRMNGRKLFRTGTNLTLNNLTQEDHGYYQCHFDGVTSNRHSITLQAPLQPILTHVNSVLSVWKRRNPDYALMFHAVAVGEQFILSCLSEIPRTRYYSTSFASANQVYSLWSEGQVIFDNVQRGIFYVTAPSVGNHTYRCQSRNEVGSSEMSWPTVIKCEERPTIQSSKIPEQVNIGDNISLSCETTHTSDGYDITWKKNGKELLEIRPTLVLNSVNEYDEGIYTCHQKVGSWTLPSSAGLTLLPLDRAARPEIYSSEGPTVRTMHQGSSLNLYCLSSSTTANIATFKLRGTTIGTSRHLQYDDASQIQFTHYMNQLQVSDSGDYTCMVTNGDGESLDSEPFYLIVGGDIGCPPGTFEHSKGGCELCPSGTYQDSAAQESCIPCSGGTFTLGRGSSVSTQCVEIPLEQQTYLRLDIPSLNYEADMESEVKNTVTQQLKSTFQRLRSVSGTQILSVGSTVIASVINYKEVTPDARTSLGIAIFEGFKLRTSGIFLNIRGTAYRVVSVNMHLTETDAEAAQHFIDIDECVIRPSVCSEVSQCINLEGDLRSFNCTCITGYQKNTTTGACTDVDECETGAVTCQENEKCVNVPGTARCDCMDGLLRRRPGDPCTEFDRFSKALYPYGKDNGDEELQRDHNVNSGAIFFQNGFPFGHEIFTRLYVTNKGSITLGNTPKYMHSVSLQQRLDKNHAIIAPFLTDISTHNVGKVMYQLYNKPQAQTQATQATDAVLLRAKKDVLDNFADMKEYNPSTVLVATWVGVEGRSSFHKRLYGDTRGTTATFQAVVITDGETSYIIFLYAPNEFYWPFYHGRDVSVGFVNGLRFANFVPENTAVTEKMDTLVGNTGYYGIWMDQVGVKKNSAQRCQNHLDNFAILVPDVSEFENQVTGLFQCPCSLDHLGGQWRWYSTQGRISCFALSHLVTNSWMHTRNKICCFDLQTETGRWWDRRDEGIFVNQKSSSGFVTLFNPFSFNSKRQFRLHDYLPHQWCCKEANSTELCSMFHSKRWIPSCTNKAIMLFGQAQGDPHITTLDGKKYTFNGRGEYTMLQHNQFVLQTRTDSAISPKGNSSRATVFTAVAAKQDEIGSFHVYLARDRSSLQVYVLDKDETDKFYENEQYTSHPNSPIYVYREDFQGKQRVIAVFPVGIGVAVTLGVASLEVGVTVDKSLEKKVTGLLGNFDGNPDNDFQTPDKQVLSSTATERQIYQSFGTKWQIALNNSIFYYPSGKSAKDYVFPEFLPLFREDIPPETLKAAENECGPLQDACIFDLVLTGDSNFANNTKQTDLEGKKRREQLENHVPSVTLLTATVFGGLVPVIEGQLITIKVNAIDQDNDIITLKLDGDPQGVTLTQTGDITLTPDLNNPVSLRVFARDTLGANSAPLEIPLVVCTRCSGQANCDQSQVRHVTDENSMFQKFVCPCPQAYDGEECQLDFDGCADSPCIRGQNCSDTLAEEELTLGLEPYTCGPCPEGFQKIDKKCTDVDECDTGSHTCAQHCENTIGNYICSCDSGYRLSPKDGMACLDIDECLEDMHECQHRCQNIQGGYRCICPSEYTLKVDNRTCELKVELSSDCAVCGQFCVKGTDQVLCGCYSRYKLNPENKTECEDVDECAGDNKPCDQVCSNTMGGFNCYCYPGFKLQPDSTTCLPCQTGYYGNDCANVCLCNGQEKACDPVRGCVCKDGFTGTNCQNDVDECEQEDACALTEVCVNSKGSYECACQRGFKKSENGTCSDVNECLATEDNDCNMEENQVCRNLPGGYACDCQVGYKKNSTGSCVDVDECSLKLDKCHHYCVNRQGGYNCECHVGYVLDDRDRQACVKVENVCRDLNHLNCEHSCSVNLDTKEAFCICPGNGYILNAQDNETCVDVDECGHDDTNGCSKKESCENTDGGYTCSCDLGYKLDNDNRTCIACSENTWGRNCNNPCQCVEKTTERCDPEKGCVCNEGYTGMFCHLDVDECLQSPCKSYQVCTNMPGNYKCSCATGFTKQGDSCVDVDECRNKGICEQDCLNFEGGYTCTCFSGFYYDPDQKKCVDFDECESGLSRCNQICINTQGSYKCACGDEFILASDRLTCKSMSSCITKVCSFECSVVNGIEQCLCPPGERLDPTNDLSCVDVDQCADNPCQFTCTETDDGRDFVCSCPRGKKLAGDRTSCEDCSDSRFGEGCLSVCDCDWERSNSCDPVTGECHCRDGYEGLRCGQNIDECRNTSICPDAQHRCQDLPGSYACVCLAGYYSLAGETCQICDQGTYGEGCVNRCDCNLQHSLCNVSNGKCECTKEYQGPTCDEDFNECTGNIHFCDSSTPPATCKNTFGGYRCVCPEGYERIGDKCKDIDECSLDVCGTGGECQNSPGSFHCSCKPGFTRDGTPCTDIDECEEGTDSCQGICSNTEGSFECSCPQGQAVDRNDQTKCISAFRGSFQMVFDVTFPENFFFATNPKYKTVSDEIEGQMDQRLRKSIQAGFLDVVVNDLLSGGLIANGDVFIDPQENSNPGGELAQALSDPELRNKFTIDGTVVSLSIKVGTSEILTSSGQCEVRKIVSPCTSGQHCVINDRGISECRDDDDANSSIKYVLCCHFGFCWNNHFTCG